MADSDSVCVCVWCMMDSASHHTPKAFLVTGLLSLHFNWLCDAITTSPEALACLPSTPLKYMLTYTLCVCVCVRACVCVCAHVYVHEQTYMPQEACELDKRLCKQYKW